MNEILRFLTLLIFVITFIVACSSETVEILKEVKVVKEIPVDKGGLVIYSGRKESLVGPIIEQFEAISGIKIEVKYGSSGEIASQIMLEGNKTPADVFYAQDPGAIESVVGMLQTLSPTTLVKVPDWAKSNEGKWIGVSGRARTLVYNTDNVKVADMPKDLNDLCNAKWKGRMGWAPTNSSFQTMLTAMRELWGEDKALAWVKCMMENDVKVYPKNTPQVEAVGKAEIDIGLVNHYYLYKFVLDSGEDDKFKARNFHLDSGGPGSLVMVSPIGILNTSINKNNAQHFINFMLSEVSQNYFVNSTREYPLIEGVEIHPLLTPLSEITKANISLSDLSDIQGSVELLQEAGALPK